MNYEKDIQIDPDQLDVEWLNQPALMMKYTRHAADMKAAVEKARQNIDLVKAELDKDIRQNPEDYALEKVTEGALTAIIQSSKKFIKANDAHRDAKYEADIASGAINAFEHRKRALENLVTLHGQQYFAGPSIPRNLCKEWEESGHQKAADSKIKLKRKTHV